MIRATRATTSPVFPQGTQADAVARVAGVAARERGSAAASGETNVFLEVRGVHKRFAGVHALRGITLAIERGEIYHLLGENGCGKSTLIKIISGAQPPDEGELVIDGHAHAKLTPIDALAAGIETVYQDLSLLPNLSVAENVALNEQLVSHGGRLARRLDRARLIDTATRALTAVGLPADKAFLHAMTGELPIATRQLVAIARAIATQAQLVIMDEPTTSLTRHEVDRLIGVVEQLRAQRVAVLFVTHKLDECYAIGGRVIVLRDGQKVIEGPIADYTKAELSHWMTGRRLDDARYRSAPPSSETRLAVSGLTRRGAFHDVGFELRRGEILGITGLLDSGRNELARALSGVRPAQAGRVVLDGEEVRVKRPADAIRAGIGYVPEDRLDEGLFLDKPIRDNIVTLMLDRLCGRLGVLDGKRCEALAKQTVEDLQIATPDVTRPVQSLSGGNQQRVLIGRWLTINPRVLILHGPTVGVDVGSKDTIFKIIQKLAKEGMGVVIISDDLPELLLNCDRIMVMRKGRVARTFDAGQVSEDALYKALVEEDEEEEAGQPRREDAR